MDSGSGSRKSGPLAWLLIAGWACIAIATFGTPGATWRYVVTALALLLMLIGAVMWWLADRRKRRSRDDEAPIGGG
ncbi:hypothetical protein [Agrococcus jenensis]|uniref:hypothetical protein n=1 Tax=Agrococcus jenensis TaxID=46353 RepID=UPI0011CE3F82|nr:hypothetical protein [Agrococcus jenensis]